MTERVLVAGVGNIFLGDDGFGSEVVGRLAGHPMPDGVQVTDFGIRGVHLAYELLGEYDTTILVDAMPRGEPPGTVSVLELDPDKVGTEAPAAVVDAHGMTPDQVFALLRTLGGTPRRVLVVGCEPADVTDRLGLSEPVAAAVDAAVATVLDLVASSTRTERTAGLHAERVRTEGR